MKKLEKEFANELKDMDVRLKNVENDVQELKKGMISLAFPTIPSGNLQQ